jgi:SAM-dependent methyltransferase
MKTSAVSPTTSHYDAAFQRAGLTHTHRCLLEHVPRGSTVLELGPASGYMTEALVRASCIVDAVELNPADAAKAARYCRKMIVGSVEDPATLAQATGRYDIALMADVLEHLRSPEVVLAEVGRRLTADGEALVSLPNIAHWRMRLELLRGRFDYTDTGLLDRTHLRFFTLDGARRMFGEAGFAVAEVLIPLPGRARFGRLTTWSRNRLPSIFAVEIVYRLRPLRGGGGSTSRTPP